MKLKLDASIDLSDAQLELLKRRYSGLFRSDNDKMLAGDELLASILSDVEHSLSSTEDTRELCKSVSHLASAVCSIVDNSLKSDNNSIVISKNQVAVMQEIASRQPDEPEKGVEAMQDTSTVKSIELTDTLSRMDRVAKLREVFSRGG